MVLIYWNHRCGWGPLFHGTGLVLNRGKGVSWYLYCTNLGGGGLLGTSMELIWVGGGFLGTSMVLI